MARIGAQRLKIKAAELLEEIYRQMRQFGLLRGPDADGQMLILPTAARYNVSYSQEPPEDRPQTHRAPRNTKKTAARSGFDWTANGNAAKE